MEQPRERREPVAIEDEIRRSYLDYAMSVIIGRALPDVRDGLKPVHRRILFSMFEQSNDHAHPFKKCARIVGDVIGKYHPHGDAAIYDALVRLAQDFSMRVPLVDGKGNFGSIDGDPPAAYRYTEARMAKVTGALLADIEKETVDFVPNYDGLEKEPTVLPTRIPNLLVNGAVGIAVGMATNIPPHNLGEVVDATVALIDDPEIELEGLMQYVKGPDFPTAAFIHGFDGIRQALRDGRGTITMRARAVIEQPAKSGRTWIVVTEIPYQVNKATLIGKIAELVKDKRIEGIADIRDESSREGIRIVIELKRDEVPGVVLNNLYKYTQLQDNFGVIQLAIVDGRPQVLGLKPLLQRFVEFRKEVVIRRTRYELREAERRAHILEGLKIALDHLDEVIATIRRSKNPPEANEALRAAFSLSYDQAQAILDMRLQRLTSLERDKILEEYREVLKTIERLRQILGSEALVLHIIKEELLEVKKQFATPRRTEIVAKVDEIRIEDMIREEEMVITVSNTGYIKRTPLTVYRAQRRGGKGKIGMRTGEEDWVEHLFVASTHDYVMVFTSRGKAYWLKAYDIPEVGSAGRGKAIVNLLNLEAGERVRDLLKVREFREGEYVFFATKKGTVKRTELAAFSNPRSSGIIALSIDEGDELVSVRLTDGKTNVLLATHQGMAIRFPETDVRPMGRTATGVRGITLREGDYVVEMTTGDERGKILTVSEKGYGKRTPMEEYRLQSRGGIGIINVRVTEKNGNVAGVRWVEDPDEVMVITQHGKVIRTRVRDIAVYGRATQGVRIIDPESGDTVVSVAKVAEQEEEPEGPGGPGKGEPVPSAEPGTTAGPETPNGEGGALRPGQLRRERLKAAARAAEVRDAQAEGTRETDGTGGATPRGPRTAPEK